MNLLKTAVQSFLRHQCTDMAAALTYYAVFAIFPAVLAMASLLSVVGEADSVFSTVHDVLKPLLSDSVLRDVEPTIHKLTHVQGAPVTLAVGAAVALWSASGYVGAFSRAMNRILDVEETRPFWKLRPYMLLVTLVVIVLNAAALVMIVATGPIADSVGDKIGIGRDTLRIWDIAKWPVLAIVVVIVVALLYHATPNRKLGRIRTLTPGAFVALLVWAAASTGFAFYVANFASYNKTYGSIAGVIVGLFWLWLTNVALLFGAELDAAREARSVPAAMTAVSGPEHEVVAVPSAGSAHVPPVPAALVPARRTSEQFPHRVGEPVYGPRTQPVPEED
ncbi:MAG: YihY family inner membrane protein [Nocardioidaceae bacterium]|nr:YihY family inner membrane protein [Nocardioidaceae bacterium]